MDKELVGWSQPEHCDQWLFVQVKASHKCIEKLTDYGDLLLHCLNWKIIDFHRLRYEVLITESYEDIYSAKSGPHQFITSLVPVIE